MLKHETNGIRVCRKKSGAVEAEFFIFTEHGGDILELPKRKKIRLESYDYPSCGAYFITICVADRNALMWNVGADNIRPCIVSDHRFDETLGFQTNWYSNLAEIIYDRMIRNEQGYREIWQYTETNPEKWDEHCFCES